jgi:hypothetical protein
VFDPAGRRVALRDTVPQAVEQALV